MDPIEQAKINLWAALNTTDQDNSDSLSARGILSALIAIAERRPQFVQVGSHTFQPAEISDMHELYSGAIEIVFCNGASMTLNKEKATAFLNWWNGYADVVRLRQLPDPTAATAYNDDLS